MNWPLSQDFEFQLLAYAGSFLGAILIYEGLRQLLSKSESAGDARNRRMRLIAGGATTEDVLRLIKPRAGSWMLSSFPIIGKLPTTLRQAGLTISARTFIVVCLCATTAISLACAAVLPPAVAVIIGFVLGFILPLVVVGSMRRRRMDKLTQQLPAALDLMARGLKVGHPLGTTIGSVGREMSDPIATEFGVMTDQVSFGDDLVSAFADLAERMDTDDIRFLAVSVAIQHGTGGDLARILGLLSHVIRNRMMLRKKVKAISAEGRASAWFLSAVPFFVPAVNMISTPSYYGEVMQDPLFRPLAAIVVVLVVANFLILQRLVRIRI